MNMSMVHGFNPQMVSSQALLPKRVREIGYTESYTNNAGLMTIVMVVEAAVAGVLALVAYYRKDPESVLQSVSEKMLKEYLLAIVTFNSLNIGYSFGLLAGYDSSSYSNYGINLFFALAGIMMPIAMMASLVFY